MKHTYLLPLFLAGTMIIVFLALFLIVMLILQKQKQNRYHLEKKERENDMLKAMLDAQEQSMNQISQELHDSIGQVLGSVNFELYGAISALGDHAVKQGLSECRTLIDRTINDIRYISHSLSSGFIKEMGLEQSIRKELEQVTRQGRLTGTLDVEGDPEGLTPEQDLMIFRIFQESLKNCLKHANAKTLIVFLKYGTSAFIMEIKDDGRGFDPARIKRQGIGMLNMQERSRALNGRLSVEAAEGSGCSVKLAIPLKN